jgi:hypothetical protein
MDITSLLVPDNADVFWEPASVAHTTSPWKQPVLVYLETSSRRGAFAAFGVPKDYVGGATWVIQWTTDTAIVNDAIFDFDYRCIAAGESVDQAGTQQSVSVTCTAPGTAELLIEDSGAATAGNFAVDDICQLGVFRDGTDVNDDMTDEARVFKVFFQYTDA